MPGTPPTTPNLLLPRYDNATDEADFAGQVNAIVDKIDPTNPAENATIVAIGMQGTYAARPTSAARGCWYYVTDRKLLYRFDGAAWRLCSPWVRNVRNDNEIPLQAATLLNSVTVPFAGLFRLTATVNLGVPQGSATAPYRYSLFLDGVIDAPESFGNGAAFRGTGAEFTISRMLNLPAAGALNLNGSGPGCVCYRSDFSIERVQAY